jgi:hypothetical protein
MAGSITLYPVANGDMTLIRLDNGQTILIDIHIRGAADDPNDDTPDVAQDLRDRLDHDDEGHLYVDAFLLSHPHEDHITGLQNHFHLGPPEDWKKKDDKILIREMWSSPVVFRRVDENGENLCDDAKAWRTEARRRVQRFRDDGFETDEGDRILIMGEDIDGKTDDILDIVVKLNDAFSVCNRLDDTVFEARLLGPLPPIDDDDEDTLRHNQSSVILQVSLAGGGVADKCRLLTGGDAEVAIWNRLWNEHGADNADWFTYDILRVPHHCSWRSLSYDRWSELGEAVEVDEPARNALSQTRKGAVIVASCKPIKADDDNPPHERAKREYLDILDNDKDRFFCTDEYWDDKSVPLEFEVKASGVIRKIGAVAAIAAPALGVSATASHVRPHG